MPLSPTPNYGLEKPTPGADDDVWGEALNRNADTLDDQVKATDDRAASAAAQAATAQATADAKVAKAGGVMTGFLTLSADPTSPLHAATRQYVLANAAGLTDAPNDGSMYGRQSLAWAKGVKLGGDTMTGALQTIAGTAVAPSLRMGDTNSGFYGGADVVAISAGGAARLTVTTTAVTMTGALTLAPTADSAASLSGRTSAPATATNDAFNIWARDPSSGGVVALYGPTYPAPNSVTIGAGTPALRKLWVYREDGSLYCPGPVQTTAVFGGGATSEIGIAPGYAAGVTPPTWPVTNGGFLAVRGNTQAGYSGGAIACYSGTGNTGVALLNTATAWSAISDEREKHILGDIADGLQAILALRPVRFRFRFEDAEAPARIGFSAQNVQREIPEAVTPVPKLGPDQLPTGEERLSLAPTELLPHLVRSIQQMAEQIVGLTARIEELEDAAP